ncbi:PepSY domain-containing protein [Marinobacterium weihaiense]|uniref:PepSY domain-containing protein n=1 Tax=Marinobacterium weihaiense TaxID=2851016 RepID=A0ABS6MAZ9_9GAMM|nr:PepSY domain-containing protein [Marinobacterium weihaiense]MBV0933468.1 PepSY domain-containing protein [Marinobacterium weihaiense]
MKKLIATLMLSGAVVSPLALADDDCKVPVNEWQSEQAFRDAIAAKGWEIKRFKIDDGCYEIYGYDEKQRRVEAYFNPKTFDMVKMELDD